MQLLGSGAKQFEILRGFIASLMSGDLKMMPIQFGDRFLISSYRTGQGVHPGKSEKDYSSFVETVRKEIYLNGLDGDKDVIALRSTKDKNTTLLLDGDDANQYKKEAGRDYYLKDRHSDIKRTKSQIARIQKYEKGAKAATLIVKENPDYLNTSGLRQGSCFGGVILPDDYADFGKDVLSLYKIKLETSSENSKG